MCDGAEPVHAGHLQIDDEHVGPVQQRGPHGRLAVSRFGEHGDLALEREQ
ncbi:hypothetical protein HD596_002163 [Nonomuraea jabiensis]|uniref:Uncharacterized protein n=1 Tax=Nonomuraea jabiensis TaxID=882448 RepID=A0A7W9L9B6_9ACTN|nr:hypothetical protein [Nonomuraea jabiensis]